MDSWPNKYIRVPFLERGMTMKGFNCWGLVKCIYENELGIILPDYSEFYENTHSHSSIKSIAKKIAEERHAQTWIDIDPKEYKPFDVIVLKMNGLPMHVGVVTKENYMIHCAKDINTVHEPFNKAAWESKVLGFCRYEKLSSK